MFYGTHRTFIGYFNINIKDVKGSLLVLIEKMNLPEGVLYPRLVGIFWQHFSGITILLVSPWSVLPNMGPKDGGLVKRSERLVDLWVWPSTERLYNNLFSRSQIYTLLYFFSLKVKLIVSKLTTVLNPLVTQGFSHLGSLDRVPFPSDTPSHRLKGGVG